MIFSVFGGIFLGEPSYARIVATIFWAPNRLIARFMLYASTCRLISVLTLGKVLVGKCVELVHDLKVPNGCSTSERQASMTTGFFLSRLSARSSTCSCTQRLTRRYWPVVHRLLIERCVHADVNNA